MFRAPHPKGGAAPMTRSIPTMLRHARIPSAVLRTVWTACAFFLALSAAGEAMGLPAEEERERKVYAHHMGSLNVGRGAMAWVAENPNLGDPRFSNGGHYRSLPLAPREVNRLTLEESADLQIRRAMAIGIDGFAMDAWAGGNDARNFLDALFKVAEENDILEDEGYWYSVIEYVRPERLSDVRYSVEISENLVEWREASEEAVAITLVPSGQHEIVVVRDRTPLSESGSNRFLRLRVEVR
jgi:hypothetical protein